MRSPLLAIEWREIAAAVLLRMDREKHAAQSDSPE